MTTRNNYTPLEIKAWQILFQIILECSGKCQDDTNNFKVVCPGSYNNLPHKIMQNNIKYKDICQEPSHNATIAYNYEPEYFEVDSDGDLVERPVEPITGEYDQIAFDYEILNPFFENYHITPTWIDCNYTWGWFDEETGHWTGAVGKVKWCK